MSNNLAETTRVERATAVPDRQPITLAGTPAQYRSRGTLFVYARRILVPPELRTAGVALGYWRAIPVVSRPAIESRLVAAGWELTPVARRLRTSSLGFTLAAAYEGALANLLRSAAEEGVQAVEIVNVSVRDWVCFKRCSISARVLDIHQRAAEDVAEPRCRRSRRQA